MTRAFMRISVAMIAASWLMFVASFFLPATNVLETGGTPPGTPLTGWQAFTASLTCGAMNPWMWVAEPRVSLFLVFPFANGLMLLSPMLALMLREKAAALGLLFVPCAIVPWCIPQKLLGDLFVGFYCWNGSFFVMSIGCVLASLAYDATDTQWGNAERGSVDNRNGLRKVATDGNQMPNN